MRHSAFTFLILWLVTTCSCQGRALTRGALVDIVISPEAAPSEKIAAGELSHYLGKLYQNTRFEVVYKEPRKAGHVIYLGCVESFPRLGEYLDNKELTRPESYIVTTSRIDGRKAGIIFGNDPAGAMYGVYNLLEKLGCGFYLSYDTFPSGLLKNFSFDGWELSDVPLVQDRIVFNWHNFLSGCSTWNLSDWKSWIIQAQKMGYNGVMVHAYGNNPMVKFSFNGQDKPIGYLSTTKKGRDWSTQHVNDVRRLWGGFVFENPVFGSEAAMVSDTDRADAARRLMHDVFAHAEERDMDVYFAVDVDTASANPQNVIETLPQQARFPITVEQMRWMNQQEGRIWLANPDTAEGYQYYKAQVKAFLNAYPQIDCLVVWFRHGNTPWMTMKAEEMPESWQKEYRDELKRTPEAGKLWRSHNFFALGKVVMAFERALKETGRDDIQIAIGSWRFDFLPGCDRFLPRHVKFIPLDWEVLNDRSRLRNSESRQVIREAGAHRPVVPVVWAHHDDGNYVGRPYTPYSDFHSRLVDSRACGFGIIHWTTRPLDLYFKSLSRQVWQSSRNQPLRVACNEMAERLFGTGAGDKMAEYLYQWVTRAPKIGRETSDHFIDRKLGDMPGVLEGYKQRMKLLNEVDTSTLEPAEKNRLNYFKGLERFIIDVYRTEDALQQSRDLYRAGDIDAARNAMAECRPEAVIEHYGQFSSPGGISRGEQGLVASMNLRWLTHYIRHRQALGKEPVRYNFAPTSHDSLAQSMGTFTFHFDPDRKVWECFGTKETGAGTFEIPADVNIVRGSNIPAAYEEICRNGIESDKSITITLQPIMSKDGRGQTIPALLPQGQYRLHLLMLDPDSTAPGQRVFDVTVQTQQNYEWYFFKPEKVKYLRLACHGNSENNWNSIHEVRIESLNRNTTQSVVTASDAIKDYPAQNTIDGKPETRWAAKGLKHWIQYRLNSNIETDRIGITWYQGNMRQPNFEILTSNDGREWTKVIPRAYKAVTIKTDRIDIFKQTERVNSILIRQYPVKLQSPGCIDITLKPIEGKAVLCGAILEPASEADGTESYKDSEVFSRENIISVMNRPEVIY